MAAGLFVLNKDFAAVDDVDATRQFMMFGAGADNSSSAYVVEHGGLGFCFYAINANLLLVSHTKNSFSEVGGVPKETTFRINDFTFENGCATDGGGSPEYDAVAHSEVVGGGGAVVELDSAVHCETIDASEGGATCIGGGGSTGYTNGED